MTNPNTAPSAAQPYAIDGVVYAIARKDQREAYVMFDTPAQANGFVEYMRRFIEKPVPAQTGGEAVAPEAKPDAWQSRWYNSDPAHARVGWSEWTQLSQQAGESLQDAARRWRGRICDTFEIRPLFAAPPAPPAPPAPLPGKRERALFQAWARDRHWNLSLRADGERYMSESTQEGWYAWKGRAALSSPPTLEAAPADYPPPDILFDSYAVYQALSDKAKARTSAENVADVLDAIVRAQRSGVSADPLPLTDTYVQPVPDKCDRITWRGQYYHLPVSSQSQPLVEPTADMVMVPREPTQEMLEAAVKDRDGPAVYKNVSAIGTRSSECEFADAYRAMLAANQVKKGEPS